MPKQFAFPKSNRLTKKKEFEAVFQGSQKVSHQYLTALYLANEFEHSRLGIIVPKRYFKLAKDRNQIRRIIRESFRHTQSRIKGLDIVVLIRSECTPSDRLALRRNIDRLWGLLA